MLKKLSEFFVGFFILMLFYFFGALVLHLFNIKMPPAVLGLVLFVICLKSGFIKEEIVSLACGILIKNMGLFIVPVLVGTLVYKGFILKNLALILFVIFVTTAFLIVFVGWFADFGLKILRLYKIRSHKK